MAASVDRTRPVSPVTFARVSGSSLLPTHSCLVPGGMSFWIPPSAAYHLHSAYPVLQHLPGLLQQLPFPLSILHKAPKGILLKCNSDSCLMPSSYTHGRSSCFHLAVPSAFTFSSAWNASLQNFPWQFFHCRHTLPGSFVDPSSC